MKQRAARNQDVDVMPRGLPVNDAERQRGGRKHAHADVPTPFGEEYFVKFHRRSGCQAGVDEAIRKHNQCIDLPPVHSVPFQGCHLLNVALGRYWKFAGWQSTVRTNRI